VKKSDGVARLEGGAAEREWKLADSSAGRPAVKNKVGKRYASLGGRFLKQVLETFGGGGEKGPITGKEGGGVVRGWGLQKKKKGGDSSDARASNHNHFQSQRGVD